MTTTETEGTRYSTMPNPHIFGVTMSLEALQQNGGAVYDGVRCRLERFNDQTGEYLVEFHVPCPQCDHHELSTSYWSGTELRVREIRDRLLEANPQCSMCERVNNGEIDRLEQMLQEAEDERQQFIAALTSPDGVKPKLTVDWRNGFLVSGGAFMPCGNKRTLYPMWLQRRDYATMSALAEIVERLNALGRRRYPEARARLVGHPELGFTGIAFNIEPLYSEGAVDAATHKLKELQTHRQRMDAATRPKA